MYFYLFIGGHPKPQPSNVGRHFNDLITYVHLPFKISHHYCVTVLDVSKRRCADHKVGDHGMG